LDCTNVPCDQSKPSIASLDGSIVKPSFGEVTYALKIRWVSRQRKRAIIMEVFYTEDN
jgi:hypothetical protein